MSHAVLDQQFENLFARARVSPYFDLEGALLLAMESFMQQLAETKRVAERFANQYAAQPLSIAKVFAWPSEELCACVHASEDDRVYIFDVSEKDLSLIESTKPMLRPIEQGDRIVILNDWTARYLDEQALEQLLSQFEGADDQVLEKELCMHAHVNARGNTYVLPEFFVVSALRA